MKRAAIIFLAILLLLSAAVVALQHWWEPGSDQREVPVSDRSAQLRDGAYLARAGNCMGCHTVPDGAPFAGGKAIATPFGTIYTSNLTPDPETGIGNWSSDDLWRAMHNGKSKDGSFLYPAFPYPNYTKVRRADSDALYAYLKTVAPVRQRAREHDLRFPYNHRGLLAFWRTLYFSPGEYQPEPAKSAEWSRGAYLVQGVGHCSACHAPRNALGGSLGEERLDGGTVGDDGWHASPLGGARDTRELSDLLQHGVSERKAVYGPMAEVVAGSLQHLAASDIQAISSYLVTLPAPNSGAPGATPAALKSAAGILQQGARIYEKQCASCHGENGEGFAKAYPRLAGKSAFNTSNAIRVVLNGGFAPSTAGNPRPHGMPPFSAVLTDVEVAAVLSYTNTSWNNRGPLVQTYEVDRVRNAR